MSKAILFLLPVGCLVFDNSVLDKAHSDYIEMVKLQYTGNAHGLIKGIGMVNCLYVNPETQQYRIVDYRIYDPSNDGKSKLDHMREMLVAAAVASKALSFNRVLMDSWYATKDLMPLIESQGKIFYCPLSRPIAKSTIVAGCCAITVLIVWNGVSLKKILASRSKSRNSQKTAR